MTPKRKTHFEQIPLEMIKKIVKENERQQKMETEEDALRAETKDPEADLIGATTANGWSERR
jgi:hypothetical protein